MNNSHIAEPVYRFAPLRCRFCAEWLTPQGITFCAVSGSVAGRTKKSPCHLAEAILLGRRSIGGESIRLARSNARDAERRALQPPPCVAEPSLPLAILKERD